MLAQQRHQIILELLNQNNTIHTSELVTQMNVSSETVRKDLDLLARQGLLTRVHGGAVLNEPKHSDIPLDYISFQTRNSQHLQEKEAIAVAAASLVKEHQSIALDYGSTSQFMAIELKKHFHSLTIVTNSIQNALILADCPDFTIILIGGIMNKDELTLINDFSPILEHLHIDVMFMTVTGIDSTIGCTDQRLNEVKMQNQMRLSASRTIVLCDSSKFGKASLFKICSVQDVDLIITDSGLSNSLENGIRNAGTELMIVS
ncbi:MAG: DeoR/GlpR family DNA-binding transcription regulator [Clostridiales bacterium]|nr:DeoR/GlpR family DNA-binding transcription regulator [Clostridiales bacterium]